MGNESGINPYADTGTGAYDGPPSEVTVTAEHDPRPTGLVEGPPAEVTVESPPEHLSEPTGAAEGPPASVTVHQWPAEPNAKEAPVEPKAVKAPEVEDKAVRSSATKKRGS